MVQDFIDSGHMNKENKDQIKKTLLCQHRHNQAASGGMSRKKSTISDFFPIGNSRRQSAFNSDLIFHSENTSSSASRKNSSIQYSDMAIHKSKNEKCMSEANLENGVGFKIFMTFLKDAYKSLHKQSR